ncbi:hypothetical protein SprV_0401584500 [Sparganum proliferum]
MRPVWAIGLNGQYRWSVDDYAGPCRWTPVQMAEESPLACPYCGEKFAIINHYWKHVQSADCSGGDCPESENVLPSSLLPKPVNADFFSQPLAPSAFRSPDTPAGSAPIPPVSNEKVGACKVCGLVFYVPAALKAHLASDEHKARIKSAAHLANEPVAERTTKAATCQVCGLDFNTVIELKAHLATPEHVARVEHATQQGKPVSLPPPSSRCMCCDITFLTKSELQQHIATQEHVQRAEKMRLSNDRLPCKSSATVSNINDNNACDNKIQLEQNHPPPLAPTHLATPEHVGRVEHATQQGKPVSLPPSSSRCICCDIIFLSKDDLKQHLETPEHKQTVEKMRQSKSMPPCRSSTTVQATASDINGNRTHGNGVQVAVEPPRPQTPLENEGLAALVSRLCEEMRPFIRSEICRLLEPICAPQLEAPSMPTAVPNDTIIVKRGSELYCSLCHCSIPSGGVEQHLSGKKHQSKS